MYCKSYSTLTPALSRLETRTFLGNIATFNIPSTVYSFISLKRKNHAAATCHRTHHRTTRKPRKTSKERSRQKQRRRIKTMKCPRAKIVLTSSELQCHAQFRYWVMARKRWLIKKVMAVVRIIRIKSVRQVDIIQLSEHVPVTHSIHGE